MYTYQKNVSMMIKGRIINWDEVQFVQPEEGFVLIQFKGEHNFLRIIDSEPKKLIEEMFKSLGGSDYTDRANMQK